MFHRTTSSSASGGDEDPDEIDGGGLPSSIATQQDIHENDAKQQAHLSGRESLLRFLLLPRQVLIVLTLEFLNSFRSFGLRFVLYNYVTNEFGISDVKAGALLGIKGFVDILFGLLGSILVDVIGVRKISIIAMSVAIIGRTLLAFGRTTGALYAALFLFSPCGIHNLAGFALCRTSPFRIATPMAGGLRVAGKVGADCFQTAKPASCAAWPGSGRWRCEDADGGVKTRMAA